LSIAKRNLLRGLALALVAFAWGTAGAAETTNASPRFENFEIGDKAYVRALAVDSVRNSMWVGTSVGALEIDLARQAVKNTFTRKDGLANEYVFALGVGGDGRVWFGTNAGGVSTYDRQGKWKTYFPMHGLADYWVYSFAFDKRGGTWIGTWDGANYVTPEGKFTSYKSELINIWVYGLDIDPQGRVWFGTEGGVSMYDGAKWSSWTHKDGLGAENAEQLPRSANTGLGTRSRHDLVTEAAGKETYNPNYVFAALVDRGGKGVWFGTWGGGVSLFDGKGGWTSFSTKDGLAGNIVYSIAQDKDGGVWFGTNHGVSHYDGKRFVNYSHADGLLGDNIYTIAFDTQGSPWFGTKGGVSRLLERKP
jgi:ligand-binding sensor domain-containing protein